MSAKSLQTHKEALEAERDGLVSAIGSLEAEHNALSAALPRLQAAAERSGAVGELEARDQAEAQLEALARDMRRKRAALAAVEAELEALQANLQAQQREAWLRDIQQVRRDLGSVADQVERDLLDAELWARLWELYARFNALRAQIQRTGGFPLGAAYGQGLRAPDKALAAYLDMVRTFEASLRRTGQHARGPRSLREALGVGADTT